MTQEWNGWYEWDPADDPPRKPRARRTASSASASASSAASAASGGVAKKPSRKEKRPSKSALQGEWGERKAEEWLVENAGLKPIGRRVKVGRDELDLVMADPGAGAGSSPREIVFVEVKTRSSEAFGGGMGAIDRRKRHALGRAASRWMMRNADCPMRIDVVEVYGDSETGRVDEIRHQRAAIPLERRINAFALGRSGSGPRFRR